MKLLFPSMCLLLAATVFSCKKSSDSRTPNPPPPSNEVDTLTAGWTKKVLDGLPILYDIFFINNTGFALSPGGIYKSTDGGDNWNQIVTGTPNNAFNVNIGMGNETNMSVAVGPSYLVSTRDGGASFDTVNTAGDLSITDVFYADSITAYAAGNSIWKTIDGGVHWNKIYTFSNMPSYQTLYFLNDTTGWVARRDGLYKTTNGGVDWQPVSTGNQFDFSIDAVVFFTDVDHGFISDSSSIGITTNGGTNWNKVHALTGAYHDLYFSDNNNGYMTDNHYILKTIDGGLTWTKVVTVPGTGFVELHFTDANHGWACGSNGTIVKFKQ